MENLSEISGYIASTLVLLTFVAKDMRLLRTLAIFSNLAFITYGTIEWLPPVLFLHLMLLPLNIVRLAEIVRAPRAADDVTQAEGAVRAQTLCTDIPPSGQSPAVPWPIFLSTPRKAAPSLAKPTKQVTTTPYGGYAGTLTLSQPTPPAQSSMASRRYGWLVGNDKERRTA